MRRRSKVVDRISRVRVLATPAWRAEDRLGETLYSGTPAPEQQLLALAHTMLSCGLVSEEDLAKRMNAVRSRLDEV